MSNFSTLDALRALRAFVTSIAEKSRLPPAAWITAFDSVQFKTLMTFTESGNEHFVTLGHLAQDNKVDFSMHEHLFMLKNDTDLLKRLVAAANAGTAQQFSGAIDEYALRVAINATLLRNYLEMACRNVEQSSYMALLKGEPANAVAIHTEVQQAYVQQIRELATVSEVFRQGLARRSQEGHLQDLPALSLVVSYPVADGELLNIYMTREQAARMREWLAKVQAGALSEANKEAAPPQPRATQLEFQYRPLRWPGLLLMAMFASVAYFVLQRAQNVAPGTTPYVHWAVAAAAVLVVLCGAVITVLSLRRSRRVTLDESAIRAPKDAIVGPDVEVPFNSITKVYLQRIQKHVSLHIEHKRGKLVVAAWLLPSAADFDILCKHLTARAPPASLK